MEDKIKESLNKTPLCNYCNVKTIYLDTPDKTHRGKIICPKCKMWFSWVSYDKTKEKTRKKTSKHSLNSISEHKSYSEPFCFFCLRKVTELGNKQVLTIDHIEELNDGGKDHIENLQILCTACHKLKNWMRLYNNWHFNK